MRCPFCGTDDTQVKDSRFSEDGASIRREEDYVLAVDQGLLHLKEFS